jgi:hypothetical protein
LSSLPETTGTLLPIPAPIGTAAAAAFSPLEVRSELAAGETAPAFGAASGNPVGDKPDGGDIPLAGTLSDELAPEFLVSKSLVERVAEVDPAESLKLPVAGLRRSFLLPPSTAAGD